MNEPNLAFGGYTFVSGAENLTLDTLEAIAALARGRGLEFGTGRGSGTVAMLQGCSSVLSIDHLPAYTEHTRKAVPVARATYETWPLGTDKFYQGELGGKFDSVLIDGPPGQGGRRFALNHVWPHLSGDFVVMMDDGKRAGERSYVAEWKKQFPIEARLLDTARGLWIITTAKADTGLPADEVNAVASLREGCLGNDGQRVTE